MKSRQRIAECGFPQYRIQIYVDHCYFKHSFLCCLLQYFGRMDKIAYVERLDAIVSLPVLIDHSE